MNGLSKMTARFRHCEVRSDEAIHYNGVIMKNKVFLEGMRDGLPIGLGYFAVAFSLGIVARNAEMTPIQGFIASFFCVASAGEYALFTSIQAAASFIEIALITLVVNARYLLMSTALTQRFPDV